MLDDIKTPVTVSQLEKTGRIKGVFVEDSDYEVIDADGDDILTVVDGMLIKLKGTEYVLEVTAIMETTPHHKNEGRARLHFRKCYDV